MRGLNGRRRRRHRRRQVSRACVCACVRLCVCRVCVVVRRPAGSQLPANYRRVVLWCHPRVAVVSSRLVSRPIHVIATRDTLFPQRIVPVSPDPLSDRPARLPSNVFCAVRGRAPEEFRGRLRHGRKRNAATTTFTPTSTRCGGRTANTWSRP